MARSDAKRQKRLAKQKAKRTQKRREIHRGKKLSMAERLSRFESASVMDCLVNKDFEERGLASLFIGRRASSGELAFAVFLIDTYCLGVKDCFGAVPSANYGKHLEGFKRQGIRPIDPPSARKLIDDAVAFAASVGLSPHADFPKLRPILDGINPDLASETFPMGKDGKPFFMSGPYQSPAECRRILAILDAHCGGPDGYHYMLPAEAFGDLDFGPNDRLIDITDDDFDEDGDF